MKKEVKNIDMPQVARDIIDMKFKDSSTLKDCLNMFYSVMEKHGIKEGVPTYNDEGKEVGRQVANPEWVMSHTLFMRNFESFYMWRDLMKPVPKKLQK